MRMTADRYGWMMFGALLVALLAGVAVPAGAASPQRLDWATLGFGVGDLSNEEPGDNRQFNGTSYLVSGNFLRGDHIWSVRFSRVAATQTGGDLALIYDQVLHRGQVLLSAGGGVGLLYRDSHVASDPLCCALKSVGDYEGAPPVAGLAWTTQALFGERTGSGFGLQCFGDLRGKRSFWALAMVFRLGEKPVAGEKP